MKTKSITGKIEEIASEITKYKFQIIFLLVYFVFHRKLLELFNTLLVIPLFATVESSLLLDVLFYVSSFFILIYVLHLWWKQVIVSYTMIGWLSVLVILYVIERAFNTKFNFLNLKSFSSFAYTDIVLVASLLIAYSLTKLNIFRHAYFQVVGKPDELKSDSKIEGFFTDFPEAIQNKSDDSYERLPYIQSLRSRILATDCTKSSFAIGIIGSWGSGKTTFVKTLECLMADDRDIIQFWFNPWMVNTPEKIVEIFFSDLSNVLNKYDRNLKDVISDYSNELIKSIDASSFKLSSLFLENSPKNSLKEQYEKINSTIRGISKRLVIYIDDIDRLDKKETLEVLRIIRNTASFGNVFFVAAFDRKYLVDSISNVLGEDKEAFIEKIFQLEYYLPVVEKETINSDYLKEQLLKIVGENYKDDLFSYPKIPNGHVWDWEAKPQFISYISNIRDAKRYLNVFTINFSLVEGHVYLIDYLNITILRSKFPEVYYELYSNRYKYLSESDTHNSRTKKKYFVLKNVTSEIQNAKKQYVIEKEFVGKSKKYSLSEENGNLAVRLLSRPLA